MNDLREGPLPPQFIVSLEELERPVEQRHRKLARNHCHSLALVHSLHSHPQHQFSNHQLYAVLPPRVEWYDRSERQYPPPKKIARFLFDNFHDEIIFILFVLSVISLITGCTFEHNPRLLEAITIVLVVPVFVIGHVAVPFLVLLLLSSCSPWTLNTVSVQ